MIGWTLSVLVGLLWFAANPGFAPTRDYSARTGLRTFDIVWQTVFDQHFDPDYNGVDWQAVRDELRPQAQAAEDLQSLREVTQEMLGRLGQSHFELIPKERLERRPEKEQDLSGGCGIRLRFCAGEFVVFRVLESSPAAEAGIQPGWILRSVDGVSCDDLAADALELPDPRAADFGSWNLLQQALYGPVSSPITLGLLDRKQGEVQLPLERQPRQGEEYRLQGLPAFYLRCESAIEQRGEVSVGVIHFSNWFDPTRREFDRAMAELQDVQGYVIDLRGNTGGAAHTIDPIAGYFFEDRILLGVQRMRRNSLEYHATPRRRGHRGRRVTPFLGPVALLVDETTGSSSEVFAGGMQSVGRVRVFGSVTAGAVLPANTKLLPTGDSLMYAIGEFLSSDGTVLEGQGVLPDVEVLLSQEDLAEGVDACLEAALEWIAEEAANER